ncbi:hypothetical protein [Faecalibacterium sp.]|uniref:hypothetical protein n=1 Tax=Faecalibacterium sp. TaxID=1971605 RepID=UPI00399AFCAA
MTNKIKRLISILLVTVLFLLTIQPAFATGNKRKIDDYSIEELLNLSVQEQRISDFMFWPRFQCAFLFLIQTAQELYRILMEHGEFFIQRPMDWAFI